MDVSASARLEPITVFVTFADNPGRGNTKYLLQLDVGLRLIPWNCIELWKNSQLSQH